MKADSISVSHIGLRGEKLMETREPHWTDAGDEREPRCRSVEEKLDRSRKSKHLEDMELPKGFRLVTPQPKQQWVVNQLVWGFWLAWAKVNKHGERVSDEYYHFTRYFPGVGDEPQMRWALEDFSRELEKQQELEREKAPTQTTVVHIRHGGRLTHHLRFAS